MFIISRNNFYETTNPLTDNIQQIHPLSLTQPDNKCQFLCHFHQKPTIRRTVHRSHALKVTLFCSSSLQTVTLINDHFIHTVQVRFFKSENTKKPPYIRRFLVYPARLSRKNKIELSSSKCLFKVSNNVINVFNAHRQTNHIGTHTC